MSIKKVTLVPPSQRKTVEREVITGTDTVTVICKIPQGILLQLHDLREVNEVSMGGTRTVKQFFPVGEPFKINGPAQEQNKGPRCRVASGFALTEDVPSDLWELWMEQTGKYHPAVINGLLQGFSNTGKSLGAAKEFRKERTGLERLNPADLPSMDRRFQIKTADEQTAEIVYPVEE